MGRDEAFGLEVERLKQWVKQNFNLIIVNSIIVCFLYGAWMFNRVPLVDTMLYIKCPITHIIGWISGVRGPYYPNGFFSKCIIIRILRRLQDTCLL